MAVRSRFSVLHFLVRLLGLTGLLAVAVGLALWQALDDPDLGQTVALAGGAVVALALLFEVRGVLGLATSRRGAVGFNVLVQVLLAVALVVGVNVYAFYHYERFDWTREHSFTLPESVREQLAELRDDTDIIVYQQYVSFGQRAENKQDKYDLAAQKRIVEKVRDLAELFQDLGPRFRVQVLDIQDDDFTEKLERIREQSPALAEAIDRAPENSVFFHTKMDERVQRLSFSDIYQLDKQASEDERNLVLIDQGVEKFARKVFNIEERRPRIGIAVVHEYLGQEGTEEFGMQGVKRVLATRGFEARDIILKKWQARPPEPTVLEHEENRYEFLDAQRTSLERVLKKLEADRAEYAEQQKHWRAASLAQLNKEFAMVEVEVGFPGLGRTMFRPYPWTALEDLRRRTGRLPSTRPVTEEVRNDYVREYDDDLAEFDKDIGRARKKLDTVTAEQAKLPVENLTEKRRLTDLRAKFNRLLADCDLLIVPRMTLFNVLRGERIPYKVHELDEAQVEAIKDFLREGKPVLFLLGPPNELAEEPPGSGEDAVEKLLAEFDVQVPPQTVLYNVEGEAIAEAMAEQEGRGLLRGILPEVPPVNFDAAPGEAQPIRSSLRLTARSFGKNRPNDLRIRHPRPVYHMRVKLPPEAAAAAVGVVGTPAALGAYQALALMQSRSTKSIDASAIFLMTDAESWNESRPFASEERVPQFDRAKTDDPERGTIREERRGPFPIGVAVEASVPRTWYPERAPEKAAPVRLAVIGHGGVFMGEKLPPMREKLLLDVSNWLLGRDDLLAQEAETWQYPRVELDRTENALWQWGTRLGLPLLFVYLGMVIWLVRRMR